VLREVRARHGWQQCARVGGVVGAAAFCGLGSTGLGVGIVGDERGDAKCQVAMRCDGDEETRASSRRRLPAWVAVGWESLIDRRGIAIVSGIRV
jgi:hypothetical protein